MEHRHGALDGSAVHVGALVKTPRSQIFTAVHAAMVGVFKKPPPQFSTFGIELGGVPIDFEKDILHYVLRLGTIAHDSVCGVKYEAVIALEQHRQSILRTA